CPASLAPANSCPISVSFTPTAAGLRSGALVVTDDDPVASQQATSLSGTGIDFSVTASPASVTVKGGTTAIYTTTVMGLGGNFSNSVVLSCSGLPAATACSFSLG